METMTAERQRELIEQVRMALEDAARREGRYARFHDPMHNKDDAWPTDARDTLAAFDELIGPHPYIEERNGWISIGRVYGIQSVSVEWKPGAAVECYHPERAQRLAQEWADAGKANRKGVAAS